MSTDAEQVKDSVKQELDFIKTGLIEEVTKKVTDSKDDFETIRVKILKLSEELNVTIKNAGGSMWDTLKRRAINTGLLAAILGGSISAIILILNSIAADEFEESSKHLMDLLLEHDALEQRLGNEEIEARRVGLDDLSGNFRIYLFTQAVKIRIFCLLWGESAIPYFRTKANLVMALLYSDANFASYLHKLALADYQHHYDGEKILKKAQKEQQAELSWLSGFIDLQSNELPQAAEKFKRVVTLSEDVLTQVRAELALAKIYKLRGEKTIARRYLESAINRMEKSKKMIPLWTGSKQMLASIILKGVYSKEQPYKTRKPAENLMLTAKRDLALILKDVNNDIDIDLDRIDSALTELTKLEANALLYKQAKLIKAIAEVRYYSSHKGMKNEEFKKWVSLVKEYELDNNVKTLVLELAHFCKRLQRIHKDVLSLDWFKTDPFDWLNLDPKRVGITNDYQYAVFAKKAYDQEPSLSEAEQAEVPGWNYLTDSGKTQVLDNLGFRAVAYYNASNHELLISFRGTVPLEIENWKANLLGTILDKQSTVFTYADTFTKTALAEYQRKINNDNQTVKLTFTGHSLGAWLAECSLWDIYLNNDENGTYSNVDVGYAVTFDSPGSANFIKRKLEQRTFWDPVTKPNITCYLSMPNLVNTAKQHSGRMIHLDGIEYNYNSYSGGLLVDAVWNILRFFKLQRDKNSIVTDFVEQTCRQAVQTLDTHKLDSIIKQIKKIESNQDDSDKTRAFRAISWPQGSFQHSAYLQLYDMARNKHKQSLHDMVLNVDTQHTLQRVANYSAVSYSPFKANRDSIDSEAWKYLVSYVHTNGESDKDANAKILRYDINEDAISVNSGITIQQLERYAKQRIHYLTKHPQAELGGYFYNKRLEMQNSILGANYKKENRGRLQ